MNVAVIVPLLSFAGALGVPTGAPTPAPIVAGTQAAPCQFPATVAILEDDETPTMCSGTLVHPELVLTAAHCLIDDRPIVGIGFGETALVDEMPPRVIAPTQCVAHPDYDLQGYPDLAYCRLSEPVIDVPIVPMLAECELDLIGVGQPVTIVGFGATLGFFDPMGELMAEGAGVKRFIAQEVYDYDPTESWYGLSDGSGNGGACFGDSGGTGYVQLDDGTWRVFGVAAQLFDPGGLPGPLDPMNVCGAGATYVVAGEHLDWYEFDSGLDLSPCWDAAGDWVGGCQDVPTSPNVAAGTWDVGCVGGPEAPHADQCLAGGGSTGGDEGTDSTGGANDSTGSADAGATAGSMPMTGGTGMGTGIAGDGSGAAGTDGPNPAMTGGDATSQGSSSSGDGEAEGSDDGGCSCRGGSGQPNALAGLWLVALLGLRLRSTSRPVP